MPQININCIFRVQDIKFGTSKQKIHNPRQKVGLEPCCWPLIWSGKLICRILPVFDRAQRVVYAFRDRRFSIYPYVLKAQMSMSIVYPLDARRGTQQADRSGRRVASSAIRLPEAKSVHTVTEDTFQPETS